jgi:hypothetical protein
MNQERKGIDKDSGIVGVDIHFLSVTLPLSNGL